MCRLNNSSVRNTLLTRSCSLRSPGRSGRGRAARAPATLAEPARTDHFEGYPRGL